MIYEIGNIRQANGYQYETVTLALAAIAAQQNKGACLVFDRAQLEKQEKRVAETGRPHRLDVFFSDGEVAGTITVRIAH